MNRGSSLALTLAWIAIAANSIARGNDVRNGLSAPLQARPAAASGWQAMSQQRPGISWNLEIPSGNPLTATLGLSPAEIDLFADAAQGRLQRLSLVNAGMVASGAEDEASLKQARQRYAVARDELVELTHRAKVQSADTLERVRMVHQLLHQRLLRGGYHAGATNLADTLQTGRYNCASATLLFVALADELQLPVQAIELPGHVRARVIDGGNSYEIEVTCPDWAAAVRRADSAVEQENAGREVTPAGLVAMIYYNRGIDAFNEHRFAEAVAANRRALVLDPQNTIARGNLLAAVNNWALALCDAGNYAEAESLLTVGQKFDPEHLAFVHNAAHVQQMWTESQVEFSGGK